MFQLSRMARDPPNIDVIIAAVPPIEARDYIAPLLKIIPDPPPPPLQTTAALGIVLATAALFPN